MQFIVKKELELYNGKNYIEFAFNVTFIKDMQGYNELDVYDTMLKIDLACLLDKKTIERLSKFYPIYHSLALYFFLVIPSKKHRIPEILSITFECCADNSKSITDRKAIKDYLKNPNEYFEELKELCEKSFNEEREKQFL